MTAPRWISTNGPMRVPSPISHPYRLTNACTTTSSPKETSSSRRCGASLAGWLATREVLGHRRDDGLELLFGDAREHRQRQRLACDGLGHWERACRMTEVLKRPREMRRLRIMTRGRDPAFGEKRRERGRICRAHRVDVPDVGCSVDGPRKAKVADPFERLGVESDGSSAL